MSININVTDAGLHYQGNKSVSLIFSPVIAHKLTEKKPSTQPSKTKLIKPCLLWNSGYDGRFNIIQKYDIQCEYFPEVFSQMVNDGEIFPKEHTLDISEPFFGDILDENGYCIGFTNEKLRLINVHYPEQVLVYVIMDEDFKIFQDYHPKSLVERL